MLAGDHPLYPTVATPLRKDAEMPGAMGSRDASCPSLHATSARASEFIKCNEHSTLQAHCLNRDPL